MLPESLDPGNIADTFEKEKDGENHQVSII